MPSIKINCPHCFSKVFVNADAICPACRGNTDEKNLEAEGLVAVEFVDGEELPPFCFICGNPATCGVKVGEKNEPIKNDGVKIMSHLLGAIGGLFSIKIGPDPRISEYKISVKIPVCESHKNSALLKPLYVDYANYRITLPVSSEFIKRWRRTE